MKTLGVIAGLGPLAGAHFYRRLIELSPATMDSEHIPVILMADPTVPSRIEHLMGIGESPVPKLVEMARKLVQAGAELIAIPSTTTSIYQREIANHVEVPMVSLIEEVTSRIAKTPHRKIGIMGTTPTRTFQVYEESFRKAGLEAYYPDDRTQSEIAEIISSVKEASTFHHSALDGHVHAKIEDLGKQVIQLAQRPWSCKLDGILLACTELPVIVPPGVSVLPQVPLALLRSTDILAEAIVCNLYTDG
ncbi:aspartate/glutamate racemase family protein [Ferroacidibacillus organovorans]|uniref:Aspartate racemase n=1 Tax=Ferroacidibacillus organovorans TaxID=1765683 RepID=A0A101XQJ3_9BACL|nr:amino acid racemase [Ferroacidibacillus organovorans]KUO95681.1 hypothetical protein ATW55_14330 [Ferroacidibacillus organovorans]